MLRIIICSLFMFIVATPMMAETSSDAQPPETNTGESAASQEHLLDRDLSFDIVYGEDDATIRIVEYASLSCPACRNFYLKAHKAVLEDYIESGDVQFVFRHFPLNAPAFRASLLVECVDNPDRKKLFLGALFKSQSEWAQEATEDGFNNKIKKIARIGGISDEEYNLCITNREVEDEILAQQLLAVKELNVKGTPAIFINGNLVPYTADIDDVMKRKIEALLSSMAENDNG